jgi:glutathione S-transferase
MGLAFAREDIGGPFGKNRDPAYLALNPNGLIPTIDDDGFILWESNAVIRYLAAKHGGAGLWPTDSKVRADADRWMDWQLTTAGPPMGTLFLQYVRTPEDKRDAKAIADAHVRSLEAWTILDAHLGHRPFVAGEAFTTGDIPLGIMVYRWFNLPIERPELPNLKGWYTRLAGRAPYRKIVMLPLT